MSVVEKQLLDVAKELCRRATPRPREAFMRRAISTAYYAVFHALARMCADELIGAGKSSQKHYRRVYRALDHRSAKSVLLSPEGNALSPQVGRIGEAFKNLQEQRIAADYDRSRFRLFYDETQALVEQADQAVQQIWELGSIRQDLAVLLLFKSR